MKKRRAKFGFSLTEVLMASAILAIGLVMIAGTFPVGIFMTAGAVEQTIAPIAADEAYAKMQLYGVATNVFNSPDPNLLMPVNRCVDFNSVSARRLSGGVDPNEYLYPSDNSLTNRTYNWAAICRRVDGNEPLVQITVFVGRKPGFVGSKMGQSLRYPDSNGISAYNWPTPVKINNITPSGQTLSINGIQQKFVGPGSAIVADASGNIYRVLQYTEDVSGTSMLALLDRQWLAADGTVAWVVPPPVSGGTVVGGKSPCIGVYQRIIKF